MIKDFIKFDKESQRTVYIKTETFNKMLSDTNAGVRVIPHDIELRNQYESYLHNCESAGEEPLSEFEYGRTYPFCSCCFEMSQNSSAEKLISDALGVRSVKVKYAEDYYGRMTDDELEITYHIA